MIGAIILIFILFGVTNAILPLYRSNKAKLDLNLLKNMYWYHCLFVVVYYIYALNNPSDSKRYYKFAANTYVPDWSKLYGTGTTFIDFLVHPFVKYLGFSYEMLMVMFAWFGYLGFVHFYIYFKENIKFKHFWQGYDLLFLIMFLPNMHFWTASLGKGAPIFLGIGLVAYGMSNIARRKLSIILGLAILYHIRPHVFLFTSIGLLFGLFSGRTNVATYQKWLVFAAGAAALFLTYNQIIAFFQFDSENLGESFDNLAADRQYYLSKDAGSGVNISNYPLPIKLLTFWFRPLFVDSPGILGLIISFENLFYVILASKIVNADFVKFLLRGSSLIKSSAVIFITASIALSFVMANLGIIMRQKSMVMYFLFFLILAFLDYKKSLYAKPRLVPELQ